MENFGVDKPTLLRPGGKLYIIYFAKTVDFFTNKAYNIGTPNERSK